MYIHMDIYSYVYKTYMYMWWSPNLLDFFLLHMFEDIFYVILGYFDAINLSFYRLGDVPSGYLT